MTDFKDIAITASRLKTAMKKKNLKAAKAKCPHCEKGFIHGRLNGHKEYLWMKCDNCSVMMME